LGGALILSERGLIRNPRRAQQINDFSGLRYGNITPTDIDGLIEYQNEAYIFFEIKYMDTPILYGQKLALERLVCDIAKKKKIAIAIIAEHNIHNTDVSVPVAECRIREYYTIHDKEWKQPKKDTTLKQMVDKIIERIEERRQP